MATVREGDLIGKGKRFGIVVSRFNEFVTKQLLDGALNQLRRSGIQDVDIEVLWVPGAFEIPLALQSLAKRGRCGDSTHRKTLSPFGIVSFHALIALGCIIRGETSNYKHIAQSTTDAISRVMMDYQIPVGFGLLTVTNFDQATARSGGKHGNKGREAALSAIEMVNLLNETELKQKLEENAKLLKSSLSR